MAIGITLFQTMKINIVDQVIYAQPLSENVPQLIYIGEGLLFSWLRSFSNTYNLPWSFWLITVDPDDIALHHLFLTS